MVSSSVNEGFELGLIFKKCREKVEKKFAGSKVNGNELVLPIHW